MGQKTTQFLCESFKKNKKEYFENINVKNINCNKKFWKTIKRFFSNKALNANKLMLLQKNNFISVNQYFTSITKQLNLKTSLKLKILKT